MPQRQLLGAFLKAHVPEVDLRVSLPYVVHDLVTHRALTNARAGSKHQDLFFFDADLVKIRQSMRDCKFPALEFNMRYFIYNFRLNFFQKSLDLCYRISDDFDEKFVMRGVGYPRCRDGSKYQTDYLRDIVVHHFSYVKTPERMAPRWVMSVEKGTTSSVGRFEAWMETDLKWGFTKLEGKLDRIRPGWGLNVYEGKHPEVLDGHPWADIKDVRKL